MKKIFWLFVMLFSLFVSNNLKAYDTSVAKYLPLQIGNVWVYYGTYSYPTPPFFGSWFDQYRITGTVDTNGHRYYRFQLTTVSAGENSNGITFMNFLRIDSSTMNVYSLGNTDPCHQNEVFVDSLRARIHDTAYTCSGQYRRCFDTTASSMFGTSIPSKTFTNNYQNSRTSYAKGIGIVNWGWTELQNNYQENLTGCIINGVIYGDTSLTGIIKVYTGDPVSFAFFQNYPNPFNPKTTIRFNIPSYPHFSDENVKLFIYDIRGRGVVRLIDGKVQPGYYQAEWDGTNYPSGVYFYRLIIQSPDGSKGYVQTKKMVLIK